MAAVTGARPGGPTEVARIARGSALTLAGVAVGGGCNFVLVVLVTRSFGPRFAGAFFVSVAIFTVLATAADLGASTGLLREVPRVIAERRNDELFPLLRAALVPVVGLSALMAVPVFVFAPQLAHLFAADDPSRVAHFLRLMAPFLVLAAVEAAAFAAVRGFGALRPYVLVDNVLGPAARPLAIGVAAAVGLGGPVIAFLWAAPVAASAAIGVVLVVAMARRHGGAADGTPRRGVALPFWRFSSARGVARLSAILVTWLDVLLIGALRSTREAGVYAAVSRLVLTGTFALQALRVALGPAVSRLLAAGRHADAEEVYQVSTWWLIASSWPVYIVMMVMPAVVLRLFGAGFGSGATALAILAAAELFDVCTGNITLVLLMAGRSSWNLANAAGSLVINVVLNLILIPRMGISGCAIAWAASIVFENTAALVEVRLFVGMRPFGRGYPVVTGVALATFGGAAAVARLVLGETAPALLVALAVAVPLYLAIVWRSRSTLQLDVLVRSVRERLGGGVPLVAGAVRS